MPSAWFSLCLAAACLAAVVPGCNIVGPAAYLIEGPPKKDAEHTLVDVPTVVFIDDRQNFLNAVSLRRVIADSASQDLMVKEALTTTISSQDAMNLAGRMDRNSHVMSIEEIGKAVGAQQVIYVEMLGFQGSPDNFTPRPTAQCRVRVIDVANRQRVFPPQGSSEPARIIQTMIREVDPEVFRTRGSLLRVNEELARSLGRDIARLFYRHEVKELGENLKPR